MAGRMQNIDIRIAQRNDISAVMERGRIQTAVPEFCFGLEQVYGRIMLRQHRIDRVDVIVVAMRQENIRDAQAPIASPGQDRRRIPRGIDHGDSSAGEVVY